MAKEFGVDRVQLLYETKCTKRILLIVIGLPKLRPSTLELMWGIVDRIDTLASGAPLPPLFFANSLVVKNVDIVYN